MEIKLMISADQSAMRFAELIGGLFQEGVVIEGNCVEPKLEKTIAVGTEPMGEFTTQDVKMETAPVDAPEIVGNTGADSSAPVHTAEELRAVALQVPKTPEAQQEVARILMGSCGEGAKPSISNVLPNKSHEAMCMLKSLAGIN